ncbi:MAG: hypothetical protein EPN94_10090 [Nitrospirae bacterium]|nr:MAG: hypothetical protein EPN94_10090 [Nitrospirota bacterium]
MKICALCGKNIETDKYFSRKTVCPECGGDLHICLNCGFYSVTAHNKCLEPKAEFQRTRDKANFCDYFVFIEGSLKRKKTGEQALSEKTDDTRKRFDALFKK